MFPHINDIPCHHWQYINQSINHVADQSVGVLGLELYLFSQHLLLEHLFIHFPINFQYLSLGKALFPVANHPETMNQHVRASII
jgi:hypothetical protein